MKWIAKRILLKSHSDMDRTLSQFVSPFIERMKQEEGITDWYCSRKTEMDMTNPSVRIYINIDEAKEIKILSKLNKFLKEKREVIGWMEKYNDPDPALPDPFKPNLKQIQRGCEIALKLMSKYSDKNRHNDLQFLVDLKKEVNAFLDSMNTEYDLEVIHFIANNLGLKDEFIVRHTCQMKVRKPPNANHS